MAQLTWDTVGDRLFETGVDHGVLYIPDNQGDYNDGVAWNGLTGVTESPTGAEGNAQYADNIKYLNLISAEEFEATLEAFTWPREFNRFDGMAEPTPGVSVGQQNRGQFGLAYRTILGNDLLGNNYGFKLHLVYGCQASPSEKAYTTVNDSPEALTFSWALTTTPVAVTGLMPTAILTIDSTTVNEANLNALLQVLYGDVGVDPRMPLPDEVISILADGVTPVTPTAPTFDGVDEITIPSVTGVEYTVDGEVVPAGLLTITEDTLVVARPAAGYTFASGVDNDWAYTFGG